MDRTQRQSLTIKRWLDAGGRATCCASTGYGKTRVALRIIELLSKKRRDLQVLIVVPTDVLKGQWTEELINWKLFENCHVEIINTVIKNNWECDLLVIDEVHLMASDCNRKVFQCVSYKFLLCLTATLERLDGKEEIIKMYAPVCDTVTLEDSLKNGWCSPIKNYLVLLDVDLTEYNKIDTEFYKWFNVFGDFNVAMNCVKSISFANAFAKRTGNSIQVIRIASRQFMRCLKLRKQFIYSHPKKIEVCRKILDAFKDKKCITFSATIKDAESIGDGFVLHSKQSKKINDEVLKKFDNAECGTLHSSKAVDQGEEK